jgi:hydrogenase maturation protein HypF
MELHAESHIDEVTEFIRVRGLVQGVGFRPTVWRLARRHGLRGSVANDGDGVCIHACGSAAAVEDFVRALSNEAPPLSRVDAIERVRSARPYRDAGFLIVSSHAGGVRTEVVPDAAACANCVREVFDPSNRRFRYPFANCTHCGPRLSIVEAIPYDRASTTMRRFEMCDACAREYHDPQDRRFHAQPIACHACGPRAWLERTDGAPIAIGTLTALDDVDAVGALLQQGHIVAIKGIGGFQLACDATNEATVSRLRDNKQRERKPFALMARDLAVVRHCCVVSKADEALLQSPAAPIVIMDAAGPDRVAASVAPGITTLGFMLPNTPMHHLILRRMQRPIVLTSGNLSEEPQCTDNADARARLAGIADYFLMHDRDIVRRVDDSVVRTSGGIARVVRRARGYAPFSMPLPSGFERVPQVLAMGAELKNTFCLLRDGKAVLSQHMGDLQDARTFADYRTAVADYLRLLEIEPGVIAVDRHPDYVSANLGRELGQRQSLELATVQHHHAHIAACMAENGIAMDTSPVLGVALDGLGYGADGRLWGGEFFIVDYRDCRRVGTFKPVAMPGGERAACEPWRNTYAHIHSGMGWTRFAADYAELELCGFLSGKPRDVLDRMITNEVNSPKASSCGRLFDAAAAAAGVCRERASYEGQAAIEFESLVDARALSAEEDALAYPFAISRLSDGGLSYVEPLAMWQTLFGDLVAGTAIPVIAARFHKGLANVIARMVEKLSRDENSPEPLRTVALSGGVFQNRVLLEQVTVRLATKGFRVLTHRQVPANDGGLALGQAVVAAARALRH